MAESFCRVGDIEICFETFGDPADPAMLLVMGLGTQMLGWHEDFCKDLASRGFYVIRYDNRDIGRSTILSSAPVPTLGQILRRDKRAASYSLAEMAADGVGLLDHLEIERAHLVGVSMGGMIAQTIAARRPERVLSLTSIMSSTGSRWRGRARAEDVPPVPAPGPPTARPRSPRPPRRLDHRLARLRARRRGPANLLGRMHDRGDDAGRRAASRRPPRLGRPHRRAAPHHRPHARHPRQGRQLVAPPEAAPPPALSPRPPAEDRGHGRRPPPWSLAQLIDAIVENVSHAASHPWVTARPPSVR